MWTLPNPPCSAALMLTHEEQRTPQSCMLSCPSGSTALEQERQGTLQTNGGTAARFHRLTGRGAWTLITFRDITSCRHGAWCHERVEGRRGRRVAAFSRPQTASCVRVVVPSLRRMRVMWVSTVRSEMKRRSAISRLVRPVATRATTSCSRGESPPGAEEPDPPTGVPARAIARSINSRVSRTRATGWISPPSRAISS